MIISVTSLLSLGFLIMGTHARLGTHHRKLLECAQGYACWEDESGNRWAKKDGRSSRMDCDKVCFNALPFHTCKQGVPALKKNTSDLAAVAAGLNFDCTGSQNYDHAKQCWDGNSPPSMSGTILVTGDNQASKNCYFPTEETLSCDEPVDGANCFGEYFASVCPCVMEEEQSVRQAKEWRLYTNHDYPKTGATWMWDLDNIFFYASSDCTGDPLDSALDGTTITDSGNAGSYWTPQRAFNVNMASRWGGRRDNIIDGNFWIAIKFPTRVDVGCVQFDQFGNFAQYIKLQAVSPGGSGTWVTVKEVKDGQAGTNKIAV